MPSQQLVRKLLSFEERGAFYKEEFERVKVEVYTQAERLEVVGLIETLDALLECKDREHFVELANGVSLVAYDRDRGITLDGDRLRFMAGQLMLLAVVHSYPLGGGDRVLEMLGHFSDSYGDPGKRGEARELRGHLCSVVSIARQLLPGYSKDDGPLWWSILGPLEARLEAAENK